jgi:enoyl-CoA hydratase/carnithine racemase
MNPESFQPAGGPFAELSLLQVGFDDALAHVSLNRPAKRNAMNDALILQLQTCLQHLPERVGCVVLSGQGAHFCAGLDLSELRERSVAEGMMHSRMWHAALDAVQFARVPVVVALHGAVVGGGLELAAAAHIRVADDTAYYGLPEGQRGIFVGGGGSVRIPRLAGVACMTDMMLTGRVLDAQEGLQRGLSQYVVPAGHAVSKAIELARKVADNAPLSNYAVTQALPRIADMPAAEGLLMESLMAAIAQGDDAAKSRLQAFLEGRAGKVVKA